MTDELLSIGDVAARAGVATSALRYWEERGLIRPKTRVSGRRRYTPSTVDEVGVIFFLRELGFSLKETTRLLRHRSSGQTWRRLAERKARELEMRIERAEAARHALEHALSCPKEHILECPNFWAAVGGVLRGEGLAGAHRHE